MNIQNNKNKKIDTGIDINNIDNENNITNGGLNMPEYLDNNVSHEKNDNIDYVISKFDKKDNNKDIKELGELSKNNDKECPISPNNIFKIEYYSGNIFQLITLIKKAEMTEKL